MNETQSPTTKWKKKTAVEIDAASEQEDIQQPPLPSVLSKRLPALYTNTLVPIDLRFGAVREMEYKLTIPMAHGKVLRESYSQCTPRASVCFVVSHPGCVGCKKQGVVLDALIRSFPRSVVAGWAIVKEIHVDDASLLTFYQHHFRFPFFLDRKQRIYEALGNRKFKNIFKAFRLGKQPQRNVEDRYRSKGSIGGSLIGKEKEIDLGGVLIFDRQGQVRYGFTETIGGTELPVDAIREALRNVVCTDMRSFSC